MTISVQKIEQKWTYAGYPYEKKFSWTAISGDDERSLPVSTTPINGVYVTPTNYRSWFCSAIAEDGNMTGYQKPQGFPVRATFTGKELHSYWFAANSGLYCGLFNTWPHVPNVSPVLELQLRERLASKALSSDFNLGQTLGELPETVALIAEAGAAALKLIRGLKRGKLVPLRSLLNRKIGSLAGDYLTFQYGIKPLIQTAYDAAQALSNGFNDKPIIRVRATVMDDSFEKPSSSKCTVSGSFARGVTGQYTFSVLNPALYELDRFGILNPLALAWELFPLSFVIDWFLHIGSFLQGLSLPIALRYENGYITTFVNNTWEARGVYQGMVGTQPRVRFRQKAMVRQTYGTFPYPLPYFHVDLNLSKVISMIALALAMKRS